MDIDITGIDKARLLMALYAKAQPLGLGRLQYTPEPLTYEEASGLLSQATYFDYLRGRVMKVDLSGDVLRTGLFDRDNGEGAAARAVDAARRESTESVAAE
jgi:hypothetical protein